MFDRSAYCVVSE